MPSSNKQGKSTILSWIKEFHNDINSVLDLGAGEGTYRRLFCVKNNGILKHAHWTAIEVWPDYIERFRLSKKYDCVICDDIRMVDYSQFDRFDLAFAGDVLEHITKEESIAVVDRVLNCCDRLIISIPIIHYPQQEVNGNPHERHVKDDWSHEEMMETFPNIQQHWHGNLIGTYLLRP